MTRKIKHILADMKKVGPICYDRCTCDLGDCAPQFAHFHTETCPIGDHARKLNDLKLEYNQAYPHSWIGRLRRFVEWLYRPRFDFGEVMVFIGISLAIADGRYWNAAVVATCQVALWWFLYRLNKIKSSS